MSIFNKNLITFLSVNLLILINRYDSALYLTEFDYNDPPVLMTLDQLPIDPTTGQIDPKLMPYVGNGHLASTIFDNKVYVNGLYNGERGESHRARVPNTHNFRILTDDVDGFWSRRYVLDMRRGKFDSSNPKLFVLVSLGLILGGSNWSSFFRNFL